MPARSCGQRPPRCISKVCSTGSRKAAVLPLPVWLDTIRSVNLAPCWRIGQVLHRHRNAFFLHHGRLGETQVAHGLQQFGRQAHFLETVGRPTSAFSHCGGVVGQTSVGSEILGGVTPACPGRRWRRLE
jgi:hypothetical protein